MSAPKPDASGSIAKPMRSRNGCRECRRIHRKCDEKHPHCQNCLSAGKSCSYTKSLSWGGRPFQKSRFGKLLSIGRIEASDSAVEDTTPAFVYSVKSASGQARTSEDGLATPFSSQPTCLDTSPPVPLCLTPEWLPWIPEEHRSLIHHFVSNLTPCFSLCQASHDSFCQTFLPLALDPTDGAPLRAAILLSATVHRNSLSSPENDIRCARLLQICIRYLRRNIDSNVAVIDDVYIATALILCLTNILAGGKEQGAWRTHLNGASASLDSPMSTSLAQTQSLSSTRSFLWRWCRALRIVALSSAQHNLTPSTLDTDLGNPKTPDDDYIDVFSGFSTDLLPIFRDINNLAVEMRTIRDVENNSNTLQPAVVLRSTLNYRCDRLISHLKFASENSTTKLDPLIPESQYNDCRTDFVLLNDVYHQSALLEIYQRVMDKPQSDYAVQSVVKSSLQTLQRLALTWGASPGVAVLHPLFIIGCSATSVEDRLSVLDTLENMRKRYAMGNVQSAKLFLLALWQRNDTLKSTGSHIQWDEFMSEKEWDLSLY